MLGFVQLAECGAQALGDLTAPVARGEHDSHLERQRDHWLEVREGCRAQP
jgi:hypothetical protein